MSGIDWATVSTSLLTSGGAVLAVYKFWFQRRLEDHKRKLENNSKLFEIELELLKEVGVINIKAQKSQLNIPAQPPLHEAFASKHCEYIGDLSGVNESYAFVLTPTLRQKLQKLIGKLESYSDTIDSCKSRNTAYERGKYCVYENFSEEQIRETKLVMKEIDAFFQLLQRQVFKSAGRNEI
ncbi:hypothetical protein AB4138_07785 [Vibrio sp. 10N.286.52.C3]|uniref:hypothetical protein n=1 Tax=Vibrio TaxID=662 RepID=UPI000C840716|nr:hypothetical protein [Vibrio cyclitrophicus]PMH77468.1 hypothetical protein BCU59_00590 [Vibrio cyclitrophicus]